jgi:hypothetical protein
MRTERVNAGKGSAPSLVHEHAPDFGLMTLQPGFLCRKSLNSSAAFFSQARTLCE